MFKRLGQKQTTEGPGGVPASDYTLISVTPNENSSGNSIFQEVAAQFSRKLNSEERSKVAISINPSVKTESRWESDNTIYTLKPVQPLLNSQKYIVKVVYAGREKTYSFTTVAVEQTTNEDQIKAQSEADQNYAKAALEQQEKYPWLDKLPIQSSSYFVYFEIANGKFTAELYPRSSSSQSIESQTEQLKREVTQKINTLGPDATKYEIIWVIKSRV